MSAVPPAVAMPGSMSPAGSEYGDVVPWAPNTAEPSANTAIATANAKEDFMGRHSNNDKKHHRGSHPTTPTCEITVASAVPELTKMVIS